MVHCTLHAIHYTIMVCDPALHCTALHCTAVPGAKTTAAVMRFSGKENYGTQHKRHSNARLRTVGCARNLWEIRVRSLSNIMSYLSDVKALARGW